MLDYSENNKLPNLNHGRSKRGKRAASTASKLTNPNSPIYSLAQGFQEYIHIPDTMALYAAMGAMAGNMLTGTPVWMMIAGDSGGGKTMILKSFLKLPKVRSVSSIKGEAALLSGVSEKDKAKDATGGLLRELGDNGCMAFMDFTSVLSKGKDAVSELLGVLRELFDGTWSRDIGGEGGRSLSHTGRVCLIAGVTHAIDRHADVNGEMGQRCLYFRLPKTSGYQESISAVNNIEPTGTTEALQDIVVSMFSACGLSFDKPTQRRRLDMRESDRVVSMAQLGVKLRNSVPRDWKTREVIDIPSSEVATRMSQQLAQLYLGMEVIGVDEEERWEVLEKTTLDSMPLIRRMSLQCVIDGVVNGGLKVSSASVARSIRVSDTAAGRTLQDLELLGIVQKNKRHVADEKEYSGGWLLTEWAEEKLMKAKKESNDTV